MSRIARHAICDLRFAICDFKFRIQNINFRIASRCILQVLLILAVAFQIPVFAEGDSDSLDLSANPKSPPRADSAVAKKIQNLPTEAIQAKAGPKSELPSATEILAQVRANLPREALLVKGQILSGGRMGKLERACYIEMFLDFTADPAMVRCIISDSFGTPLEQMMISMSEGGETEYDYETGNPLRSASAPPPSGVIRDTDVTWNDISLLFLWRSDGRLVREENLRGRDCYVLEFPGNAGVSIENRKSSALGGSASGGKIESLQVVWIDMQMLVLIQAEEINSDGRLQRRMIVKNIKKISEQWMVKNIEIRAYPSLHHTLIRVDEVIPVQASSERGG